MKGEHQATALLQLAVGCLLGLLTFAVTVPGRSLTGGADGFTAFEDQLTYIASLRYFVWDEWRWPLMRAARLGGETGTVIIFTDAIPLYGLALRLIRWTITPDFNFLGVWLGLCYALQGLAAAAAVRMWGITRWLPCLAAEMLALSMPAWLGRMSHAALCLHAVLLFAIGLQGLASRSTNPARPAFASLLLCWTALALSAYFFVMVAVLTVALVVQLWLQGWPGRRAAVTLAALAAGAALEMWVLGFFEPHGIGIGFEVFSMNLLSPVHPDTGLLGRLVRGLDATGGQYEGFNYLGLGLLVLVPIALWSARDRLLPLVSRYWPLLVAASGLTMLSLSNRIYAGKHLLLSLPAPPTLITQFRAPGRFFWPVAYLILVTAVVLLARRGRGMGFVLIAAAALQWADAAPIRASVGRALRSTPAPSLDRTAWVPLLEAHRRVVVAPEWDCAAGPERRLVSEVIYLASIPRTEITTVRSARPVAVDCARQAAAFRAGRGIDSGTLVVVLDSLGGELSQLLTGWHCVRIRGGHACSALPVAGALLAAIQDGEP